MPNHLDGSIPALFRAGDLHPLTSAPQTIRTAVARGSLAKVRRGVYIAGTDWAALDHHEMYRVRVHAAARTMSPETVFSHYSAAALWGLPIIGPWPLEVHVLVPRAGGGRSDPGVRRHALGLAEPDFTSRYGIHLTTLARTVIDLAVVAPLYSAIATADAAIHVSRFAKVGLLTKDDLYAEWQRMLPFRGSSRALRTIDFAVTGSGSTSESGSRVSMALLGFPRPELQREFRVDGRDLPVDFYFPEVDGIGECDGDEKYTNPALRSGRTIEEVVLEEKARENALRRQVTGFRRWGSREALSPALLRRRLLELGLRQGRPQLRGR